MSTQFEAQRLCAGVSVLLIVDFIWVGSSEVTEHLFKNEHYNKPFFSTYLKTTMFLLYLFGFLIWRSWRDQCRRKPEYTLVDPNQEDNIPASYLEDSLMSDPMYVPIRFHDGADKSSGTESDDSSNLGHNRSVRFSKLTEVRQLSESQAEDAVLARLSFTASLRAQEEAARLANKLGVRQVAKIAAQFSLVWFAGNCSYQVALAKTQAGVVNLLSSTSGFFTLILASIFPANNNDRFTLSKFFAVLLSIGGIVVVTLSDASFEGPFPVGAVWSLSGSFFYAVYIVMLRRKVDNEDRMDISMFFGFVGLFTLVFLWPVIVVLHFTGLELFVWPTHTQWMYLVLNGLIGTVFSELLWLLGCFLTSSLIGTLSLSLTIPLTMVADIAIKNVTYSHLFFVGMVPVFVSFLAVTLLAYYENWDPVMVGIKRLAHCICGRRRLLRLRDVVVDKEQTESLMGINSNEEHDA